MGGSGETLRTPLEALWRIPPPGPDNLFSAPAFVRLSEAARSAYPNAGRPVFALGTALRSLGLPCGLPADRQQMSLPVDEAARRLDAAFLARSARRRHLVPLDLADDLPALAFGTAKLGRYSADELLALVDGPRLERVFPGVAFEAERFSQFYWLTVEEAVALDQPPEARAVPVLFMDLGQDLGRIEPHKGRFPPAVEDALFFLLLAPWEEWSRMPEVDWRGFRVPWVYTADEDLFVRPQSPPSPDSLAWEMQAFTDAWGEVEEVERPVVLHLEEAATTLNRWDEASWQAVVEARRSPLFETPVVHFFVRAYLAEGVDEVLGHLTAIEAALGVRADYERRLRPKPDPYAGRGGTWRLSARIAALLGGRVFADEYERLFRVRSAFLHGRAMGAISTAERVLARQLSRQVVAALVDQGLTNTVSSREDHLQRLLDRGASLL